MKDMKRTESFSTAALRVVCATVITMVAGIGIAWALTGFQIGSDGNVKWDRTSYTGTPQPTNIYSYHSAGEGGFILDAYPTPTAPAVQIRIAATPVWAVAQDGDLYGYLSAAVISVAQGLTFEAGSGGDVSVKLPDAAGARLFRVLDSGGNSMARVDSDGNARVVGRLAAGAPTGTPTPGDIYAENNVSAKGQLIAVGEIRGQDRIVAGNTTVTPAPTPGDIVAANRIYSVGDIYVGQGLNVGGHGTDPGAGVIAANGAYLGNGFILSAKWISAGQTPTATPVDGTLYGTYGDIGGLRTGFPAPTPFNTATNTPTRTPTATNTPTDEPTATPT